MTSVETSPLEKLHAFTGCCSVCGEFGVFTGYKRPGLHPRDQFACALCGTTLRYRDQATAIVHQFSDGVAMCLDDFVQTVGRELAILEFGLRGPFVNRFRTLPGYCQAYLFEDQPLGDEKDGVHCEDIRRTTFADKSFDLIVTSDVLEHVADWRQAVAEVARLLRPGGAHIFTVPLQWPLPAASTARAELVDGEIVHHLAPRFHVSGTGGKALVFTDFGEDLLDYHRISGLDAWFFNGHLLLDGPHRVRTIVAVNAPTRCTWQLATERAESGRWQRRARLGPAAARGLPLREVRPDSINSARCLVCGWRPIYAGSDPLLADCPACRATTRSMHLGAMLLSLGSRGVEVNLSHFAGHGLGGRSILDLTGDPAIRAACRVAAGYRAHSLMQCSEGAEENLGAEIVDAVSRFASVDILLLRDVLQLVPDLEVFVGHIRRLLRPAGAVVFQDRFFLPLAHRPPRPQKGERQLVVRYGATSGVEKLCVPVCRHLGTDSLDLFAAYGLVPTVELPPAPSLLAHRHVAVVARKISQVAQS